MKHASQARLEAIASFLDSLRAYTVLRQKSPGIYYYKSRAFLHFHEDAAGLFADLNMAGEWIRFPANSRLEQKRLLRQITLCLAT